MEVEESGNDASASGGPEQGGVGAQGDSQTPRCAHAESTNFLFVSSESFVYFLTNNSWRKSLLFYLLISLIGMAEFETKMLEKKQELEAVVSEIDRVNQELTNTTATAHQTAEEIETLKQQKQALQIDIHKLSALMILLRKYPNILWLLLILFSIPVNSYCRRRSE
jgi:hypothetical protein